MTVFGGIWFGELSKLVLVLHWMNELKEKIWKQS